MKLNILIVHISKSTRMILKNCILSIYRDSVINESITSDDGLNRIVEEKFDIILSGLDMAKYSGIDIFNSISKSELNKHTPFILVTANFEKKDLLSLEPLGIKNVLPMPFLPHQVRILFSMFFDKSKCRMYPRYKADDIKATITLQDQKISADVLNISLRGIFCKFKYPAKPTDVLRPSKISLELSSKDEIIKIENITVCAVRIHVESWQENNSPYIVNMAFKFTEISANADEILKNNIVDIGYKETIDHYTWSSIADEFLTQVEKV